LGNALPSPPLSATEPAVPPLDHYGTSIDGSFRASLTYDLRMRRLALFVVVLACSAPAAKSPASPADWTARCSARVEAARTKLGLGGATKADATPWNPRVRFERHVNGGYYEATVEHGRDACIDFDSDDPSYTNLEWSNGSYANKVATHRIRRVDRDEAWLDADKIPRETVEPFRAAFEDALEACLQDARGVALGPIPKDVSCMDKRDVCPIAPSADTEDGCPSQ
jgi:hypothetical protein